MFIKTRALPTRACGAAHTCMVSIRAPDLLLSRQRVHRPACYYLQRLCLFVLIIHVFIVFLTFGAYWLTFSGALVPTLAAFLSFAAKGNIAVWVFSQPVKDLTIFIML